VRHRTFRTSPDRTTLRRTKAPARIAFVLLVACLVPASLLAHTARPAGAVAVYRIDHVADGDTVSLTNGARVRLVQIDTPEVYFETECYGPQASAITKRLLPPGTEVRLVVEPATDRVDAYGRLLRYGIRARDGLDVNVHLVAIGAAAPYFYDGRRGMYAALLERLAKRARAQRLGLWRACPRTPYNPYRGVATQR
jgi:micrococcal nuclease